MNARRRPRAAHTAGVAVFDLDGTLTRHGTYAPLIWGAARRDPRKWPLVLPVLAAAVLYKLRLLSRGRLKEIMLTAAFGGVPCARVREYAAAFADRWIAQHLRPGALEALRRHQAAGDFLILATASFDFYAEIFAERLGFDAVIATRTVCDAAGRITGRIDGQNCLGEVKLERLCAAFPDLKTRGRVCAYSDHHADLPLLCWAHAATAVNPTARLRRRSADLGIAVVDWEVVKTA